MIVDPESGPRPTPPRSSAPLAFATDSGEKRRTDRRSKRKVVEGRFPDVSGDNELAQLIRKRGPQMVHRKVALHPQSTRSQDGAPRVLFHINAVRERSELVDVDVARAAGTAPVGGGAHSFGVGDRDGDAACLLGVGARRPPLMRRAPPRRESAPTVLCRATLRVCDQHKVRLQLRHQQGALEVCEA